MCYELFDGGGQDYDEAEAVARLERIKRAREPDEDGFVVVKTKNKVRWYLLSF